VQISKALVYSKIQFLIRKDFSFNFRPNQKRGQPTHPAFWPTQPSQPSSSSSRTGAERASCHRRPTSRHPHDRPRLPPPEGNNCRITPLHFTIKRRLSLLFNLW
jgi:hypothetical protein